MLFSWIKSLFIKKNIRIESDKYCVIDLQDSSQILGPGKIRMNAFREKKSRNEAQLILKKNAKLTVRDRFDLYPNSVIKVFENGHLDLGRSFINSNSCIMCSKYIRIGNNVKIARGVYIYDCDHHKILSDANEAVNVAKPVVIEDSVWIGVNSVILKGTTIGEGAIVAAGSVVTKDVPPHCMVAGVPAEIKRKDIQWK